MTEQAKHIEVLEAFLKGHQYYNSDIKKAVAYAITACKAQHLSREKVEEIMSDAFLKCSPFNTKEVTDKICDLAIDDRKRNYCQSWGENEVRDLRVKMDFLINENNKLQAKLTKATDALREIIKNDYGTVRTRIAQQCLDEICVPDSNVKPACESDKGGCDTQPNLECPNCHYILTPIIEDCDTQPIEPLDLDQGSIYIQCSQNVLNGVEWTVASKINEIIDRLKEKGI